MEYKLVAALGVGWQRSQDREGEGEARQVLGHRQLEPIARGG